MNHFGNGAFVWFVHYHTHGRHLSCGWIDAHLDAFNWGGE